MQDSGPRLTHSSLGAKGTERGTVVLLHGFGADEDDMLGLSLELPRDLRYVAMRGPSSLPWGGYAWYPMSASPVPPKPEAGPEETRAFTAALDAVCAWLCGLATEGTSPERTVLAGFSQGAAVAAAVLCRPDVTSLAGYGILSGYLHPACPEPQQLTGRRVFVAHGRQDPLLAPAFAAVTRDRLAAAGAHVLYRTYPAAHTICAQEIDDLGQWLSLVLPPTDTSAS